MRMAYCVPKIWISPTPGRRLIGSFSHAGVVVGEVRADMLPSSEIEADDDQEVAHRLVHLHALLLHLLRQERRGELQLVLHLHLRDVRIGAALEGDA